MLMLTYHWKQLRRLLTNPNFFIFKPLKQPIGNILPKIVKFTYQQLNIQITIKICVITIRAIIPRRIRQ